MKISKIRNVKTPVRGTGKSAGLDFFIPEPSSIGDAEAWSIGPGESALIPSGIKAQVPKGFALIAFNKSGISTKKGLAVGACVVDEDYQGEIHIHLMNTSNKTVILTSGEKVVQFILLPVFYDAIEVVDEKELFPESTERGEGGFGSTGNN